MGIKLKAYQENNANEIVGFSKKNLTEKTSHPIVCSGPTGCGKTGIYGSAIIQLPIAIPQGNFCFMVLTGADGGLPEQIATKLKVILPSNFKIITPQELQSWSALPKNAVITIGWQKIWSSGSKTGGKKNKRINKLLRNGDIPSLTQILERTRKEGKELILILDEFHRIANTANAIEIINKYLQPRLQWLISATPPLVTTPFHSKVTFEQALEAQMVKKRFLINHDIAKKSSAKSLFTNAYNKRLELKQLFASLPAPSSKKINPLCGIQIPNGAKGREVRRAVMAWLKRHDITVENGRLAIWLDQCQENLEGINALDSKVEFIIFKQAITQGWDCPRAYVWLKFRDTKSEVFNHQCAGRFGRTPEQMFYDMEELNQGYIYTDDLDFTVDKLAQDYFQNSEPIYRQNKFQKESIELKSSHRQRNKFNDTNRDFYPILEKTLIKKFNLTDDSTTNQKRLMKAGVNLTPSTITQKISKNLVVEGVNFRENYKQTASETANYILTDEAIIDKACEILAKHLNQLAVVRCGRKPFHALLRFFKEYVDSSLTEAHLGQIIYHDTSGLLTDGFDQACKIQSQNQAEQELFTIITQSWTLPTMEIYNTLYYEALDPNSDLSKKYLLHKCYLKKDRSKPEQSFESALRENRYLKNTKWWYKFRESTGQDLAIPYEINGQTKQFFVDYLIKSVTNRLKVVETKSIDDFKKEITKIKAEAGQRWAKALNKKGIPVDFAIAIEINGVWYVNTKATYNLEKMEQGNYDDWTPLLNFLTE